MSFQLAKKCGFNPVGWDLVRTEAIDREPKLINTSLKGRQQANNQPFGWAWFSTFEDPHDPERLTRQRVPMRPQWHGEVAAGQTAKKGRYDTISVPLHINATTQLLEREKSLPDLRKKPYAPYIPVHLKRNDPDQPKIRWTEGPYPQMIRHPSIPHGYFNNKTLRDWVHRPDPKK